MHTTKNLEHCRSYVASQGHPDEPRPQPPAEFIANPAITLSYHAGIEVGSMAQALIQRWQPASGAWPRPWRIMDRELVEQALRAQRWPEHLAGQLDENRRPFIAEWLDDVFGFQPPSWVLVPQLMKVISQLAAEGCVILIGHGSTVVTSAMTNVFHVRLTGSLPCRAASLQASQSLSMDDAVSQLFRIDQQRADFLKTYFHTRLDNELLYDLTINTDRLARADVIELVWEGAQRFFLQHRK